MRLLYKFQADGVWFSKNGTKAYQRGEKPAFMWPEGSRLIPTVAHHIARLKQGNDYTRELVMFYELDTEPDPSPFEDEDAELGELMRWFCTDKPVRARFPNLPRHAIAMCPDGLYFGGRKVWEAPPPKAGRNDPCPCQSGKKFKRCCGK